MSSGFCRIVYSYRALFLRCCLRVAVLFLSVSRLLVPPRGHGAMTTTPESQKLKRALEELTDSGLKNLQISPEQAAIMAEVTDPHYWLTLHVYATDSSRLCDA